MNDAESFQNDALWRNFSQPDAQEKSRKSRKVSIERWHHIQEIELENGTDGFKRPRRPKITFEGHILLFDGCRAGNEDELLYLISNGVDVNTIGPTGETALILCAAAGHARLALHLVRAGANVDAFDGDGWTALHHACYHDHYSVMLQLLEAKANVFAVDFDLNFPINHIRHNSPLLLTMNRQMTTRKGINPEIIRGNHSRILNEMTLNMIARTKKANCFISGLKDFKNEETGVTLAHCLASYGLHEALQVIIDLDKDVVNKVDYSGFTPLHCAAKFGQLDCLKVLLKAGADVKAVDKYQVTARHYCFQQEGRALLDGVPILNEVDGAVSSKKSKKKSTKNKIDEAPRKPKESIKRLQKSVSKKESKKVSSSGGGVCSKFIIQDLRRYEITNHFLPIRRMIVSSVNAAPRVPPRNLQISSRTGPASIMSKRSTRSNSTRSKTGSSADSSHEENPYSVVGSHLSITPRMTPLEMSTPLKRDEVSEENNLPPVLPPKSQNESHELSPANIFFGTDRLQNDERKVNRPDETEENEVFTEHICQAPTVEKPPRNFSYSNSTQSPETSTEIKEESKIDESLQNSFFNRNYEEHDESLPPAPVLPVKQKRSSRTFSTLERQVIKPASSQIFSSGGPPARNSSEIEEQTTPELPAKQRLSPKSISNDTNDAESQSSIKSQSSHAQSLKSLRSNSMSSAQSSIVQSGKVESDAGRSRASSEIVRSKENVVLYMECLPRKESEKDQIDDNEDKAGNEDLVAQNHPESAPVSKNSWQEVPCTTKSTNSSRKSSLASSSMSQQLIIPKTPDALDKDENNNNFFDQDKFEEDHKNKFNSIRNKFNKPGEYHLTGSISKRGMNLGKYDTLPRPKKPPKAEKPKVQEIENIPEDQIEKEEVQSNAPQSPIMQQLDGNMDDLAKLLKTLDF